MDVRTLWKSIVLKVGLGNSIIVTVGMVNKVALISCSRKLLLLSDRMSYQ